MIGVSIIDENGTEIKGMGGIISDTETKESSGCWRN